jgi:hypothetical protein
MMDTFEAVRTLLAVRNYQDKPVLEASLRRILRSRATHRQQHEWTTVAFPGHPKS